MSASFKTIVSSISATLYKDLEAFQRREGLESIEQAIELVLTRYFHAAAPGLKDDLTAERLRALEGKCRASLRWCRN